MVRLPPGWQTAFHQPTGSQQQRGLVRQPTQVIPISAFGRVASGVPLQPGQAQAIISSGASGGPAPPANVTVTATQTGTTNPGTGIWVLVLTGQAASQAGGATASFLAGSGVQTEVSITPVKSGGFVVCVMNSNGTGSFTLASGTPNSLLNAAGTGNQLGGARSGLTTAATPLIAGWTGLNAQVVAAEIQAATTLTVDPSTPAAASTAAGTAITSPAFSPPANSIIVVGVITGGGGGTNGINLTNNSGLSFTPLATNSPAFAGTGAIYFATIPASGTPTAGGTAQVTLGPTGLGNVWYPTQVTVSTSTGPLDTSVFNLYLGPAGIPITLVGTCNGGAGTIALAIPSMTPGQFLIGVWTGGHAGDLAAMNVIGTMDALST